MNAAILRCSRCSAGGLIPRNGSYECGACGTSFPVRDGVLLLFPANACSESRPLDYSDETWREIVRAAELPLTDDMVAAMRRILTTNHRWGDIHLSAENNYYLFRNNDLRHLFDRPEHIPVAAAGDPIQYQVESHLVPETLAAGADRTWNVRLTNRGSSALSSGGVRPAFAACRWRNARGEIIGLGSPATRLPIDLPPGRTISFPLRVVTPTDLGPARLELGMVDGQGQWIAEGSVAHRTHLVERVSSPLQDSWSRSNVPADEFDSVRDHQGSAEFLAEEFRRQGIARPCILEVGGGLDPMSRYVPNSDVVSVDIDVQTMQIGSLRLRDKSPNVQFVAADAFQMPFEDASFDAVCMIASFHHFPDPAALLRKYHRVLRPGGFVMLGAEPLGTYTADNIHPELKFGLEHGINEQAFTEEEYVRLFMDAGFFPTRVEIHQDYSLRAILRSSPLANTQASTEPIESPMTATPPTNSPLPEPGLRDLVRMNVGWMKRQYRNRLRPLLRTGE